jgi:hypothetical protein
MSEEIHELHEHASEGRENPSLAPVTLTMAILAVVVAATSLLGHRAHTEELLAQSQASDRWAEYQAKSIRRHGYEQVNDLLEALDSQGTSGAFKQKYREEAQKAKKDQDEIQQQARESEGERDLNRRRADRFDLGEVVLEASLVITSLTLLTKKKGFWALGVALAGCGIVVALLGFTAR